MSYVQVGLVVFAITFGSAVAAMVIRRYLPARHMDDDTKAMITLPISVLGTLSALVIGLLLVSGNSLVTTERDEVNRISANIVRTDRILRRYGPEMDSLRKQLWYYAKAKHLELFPDDTLYDARDIKSAVLLETLQDKLLHISPGDEAQRWLLAQALLKTNEILDVQRLLAQRDQSVIPFPFVVLLVFWLAVLFMGFGVFATPNPTAIVAIFLCALAVSGAIEMTLDFGKPFQGLLRISDAPMRQAIEGIVR